MLGTAVSYRVQKEKEESKCIASLRHRHILLTTAVWYSASSPSLCPKTLLWFCDTRENWSLHRSIPTGYNSMIPREYLSYPVLSVFSHRCWTSPFCEEEAAQGSSSNCGFDSLRWSTSSFYKNRWIEMEIARAFRGEKRGEEWQYKISMLKGWNRESKVQLKWYGLGCTEYIMWEEQKGGSLWKGSKDLKDAKEKQRTLNDEKVRWDKSGFWGWLGKEILSFEKYDSKFNQTSPNEQRRECPF